MAKVRYEDMERYVANLWQAAGGSKEDAEVMGRIYKNETMRGQGHHDIHNFLSRLDRVNDRVIHIEAKPELLSSFGGMECWEGNYQTGEVLNTFIMQRAIDLAQEHGIGLATVRHSNHYLDSAPYTEMAAKQGCIGMMMAKSFAAIGMPGINKRLVGQAPVGYAFPTGEEDPVMQDMCMAVIAGEPLAIKAKNHETVPPNWGHTMEGKPAETAEELMRGIKYPIGLHKGFGMIILEELLTGVLSLGSILNEGNENYLTDHCTCHTAIAIKTDALMSKEVYEQRSSDLIHRIRTMSEGKAHIPGDRSWAAIKDSEAKGYAELEDEFITQMNEYAAKYSCDPIPVMTE